MTMNLAFLPIYGPFSIHLYGVCIATGIIIALYLAHKSSFVAQRLPHHLLFPLFNFSLLAGIVGGRVLFVITQWSSLHSFLQIIAVWDGGLSVLGSMIAILLTLVAFVRYHKLNLLATLDIAGLYGPLVQACGRIGCFFAGCCYGTPTNGWWSVTYTNPLSNSPYCIPLHPTQLYNSALLFLLFIFQYWLSRFPLPSGLQLALGLGGLSFIRFITDFWRGDRETLFTLWNIGMSTSQLLSLVLLMLALAIGAISIIRYRTHPTPS